MERADIDGVTLEYRVEGEGEPVLLIHGALIADSYRPLLDEPTLTRRHRLIAHHRRGYGGSAPLVGAITIEEQASDCLLLLRHLGIDRLHVVGHSYGGSVALQMALDTPDLVHSLVLLEPALFPAGETDEYRDRLLAGQRLFRVKDTVEVVDSFLRQRFDGDYRALLDDVVPGAFSQAVADAGTFFEHEINGLVAWELDPSRLGEVDQPTLSVLGGRSAAVWPRFGETHRRLLDTLPDVEGFILPDSTHLLQLENPSDLVPALMGFWDRHPLGRG